MRAWRFRPRLIPTLATLIGFALLLALGFWQLDRAKQKEAAESLFQAGAAEPSLVLNQERLEPEQDMFRRAEVAGRWDDQRQFLLDNQTYQSKVGYSVLTPLQFNGPGGRVLTILVDRGWVEADLNRDRLPVVHGLAPEGERWSAEVRIRGHLDFGPATGLSLGGLDDGETGWPLRVQRVEFDALSTRLGSALLPMVLRLDPDLEQGYVRDWRPAKPPGFGPERNRGYAVQWFGLAAALLVIFLSATIKREDVQQS